MRWRRPLSRGRMCLLNVPHLATSVPTFRRHFGMLTLSAPLLLLLSLCAHVCVSVFVYVCVCVNTRVENAIRLLSVDFDVMNFNA